MSAGTGKCDYCHTAGLAEHTFNCPTITIDALRASVSELEAQKRILHEQIIAYQNAGMRAGFVFGASKSHWIVEHEPNTALTLAITQAEDMEQQRDAAFSELATEKARLDWLLAEGCYLAHLSRRLKDRTEIDFRMARTAARGVLPESSK